jgi:ATP-dependent helicase/nuclease subunit A
MVDFDELTDEQKRAVKALDRNVTLTAGAGTGKTTTLTARYLRMLEASIEAAAGDDSPEAEDILLPENILTTTFTERAANELEESIRTDITDRISELDADEFEAWRTIADELEDGYIHTLHGFCARLLREHALSIEGIDPGFEPIDEDETAALIHDTVGTVLEDYEDHDATRTLAKRFSRQQLRDVLTDLLGERPESIEWAERWADASIEGYIGFVETELHPIGREEAADRLAQPDVVDAVAVLSDMVEDPPDIDTGGTAWQRVKGVIEILDDGFDDGVPSRRKQTMIAELSRHLTTSGDQYASYTGAKTRWSGHSQKDAFDEAIQQLVEAIEPEEYAVNVDLELEANSFQLVTALAELTMIASEEYEDRKRRQNVRDFSDLISFAVEFLEADENEAIRQELREQFEYVMVDEFQDTDPRQWDLIKLLTASEKGRFDAQNVFVVGDAKQSIYRFRNADVAQFQETAETLERTSRAADDDGNERDDDQLSTNFRTLPTVLETINELFDAIFVEDGEAYEAVPQRLSPDRDDPADIGSVEYLPVPTDPTLRADRFDHYEEFAHADPDDDAELEAMALAARLSQVLDEPYQVYPEDTEDDDEPPEPRAIEPSDIAILIRSRTKLKTYERALHDADVPYSVASGIGFYETTEITALLNLFRALADPQDERALYAVLRSPLFGFTDDTLARLKIHDEPLWEALASADVDELVSAYDLLCKWRRLAGVSGEGTDDFDGSWAALLTQIIEDTGYFVSISAGDRPQQAIANVEKFRQRLRGWSDDGVRSLTTLVNRIEQRIDLGGRESEAETSDDGVQILTIHDAKGMEFPFVAVPGLGRGFNDEAALGSGAVEFERVGDHHAVGMKAPSLTDSFEMEDTIAREALRERRRREEHAEEKRVLYVACTRARDHLLLTGLHDLEDDDEAASFTNLEEPDPDSPSSWRDWTQPELLPDEVCAELDDANHVQRPFGKGSYRVSVPTPEAELEQDTAQDDPPVTLSPTPALPESRFRLSATDLASLLGGCGEIQFDEETRTAYVEEIKECPDDRHGEKDLPDDEQRPDQEQTAGESDEEVTPRVFGEMVHRLCELRPSESQWADLMTQTLVDKDAEVELTTDLQQRVSQHARRGIEYVERQTASKPVEQQYDELYVTAEFERGEIAGYIDHLLITPDEYHIIDYKTGSVTSEEIDADAEYYANQMKAYAVALYQQETGREARASLVFTDIDEAWETSWTADEVEAIEESIHSDLVGRF